MSDFMEEWKFFLENKKDPLPKSPYQKKMFKDHPKMAFKTPKSMKRTKLCTRSKIIAPRIDKDPKKGKCTELFWTPQGIQNQPTTKKKGQK